jgi:transcriptional regulator with XRE-family HTH domain
MERLGDILRHRRRLLGLTLREAAEKAGVSNPYLSQIETHKILSPSPSVLKKLSDLYSIPYNGLLELAGHPPANNSRSVVFRTSAGDTEITKREEKQLYEYLQFLRTRRSRK